MVQADEKAIQAIINTVKGLPVDCKNFSIADSWVGIVLELERIAENTVAPEYETAPKREEPQKVDIKYAPPDNIIKDAEVVTDG